MARYRRSFRRGSKPVHPTKWCATDLVTGVGSTSGVNSIFTTICPSSELEGFTSPTIVRVVGWIEARLGTTADAGAGYAGELSLGIRIMDDQISAPGDMTTADEMREPWMWTSGTLLVKPVEGQIAVNSSGTVVGTTYRTVHYERSSMRWDLDIKVMRRVPQNFRLVLCDTIDNLSADANIGIACQFRVLIKE